MRKSFCLLACSCLFVLVCASSSFAQMVTYNAKNTFVSSSSSFGNGTGGINPNGVWSYGYSTGSTAALSFFTSANAINDSAVYGYRLDATYTPGVWITKTNFAGNPIGAFVMHPGTSNTYAAIRFTAPSAGTYNLSLDWVRPSTQGNGVHVYAFQSGSSSNPFVNVTTSGTNPQSFSQNNLSLTAGQTIDLRVGPNSDFTNDSTVVGFQVVAVPEPATIVYLGGLVAGLGVLSRRRWLSFCSRNGNCEGKS